MNPQISCRGFSPRMSSHNNFAPDWTRGWNSFKPLAELTSKTPSHLPKNGHSSDVDPKFITSTTVHPAPADESGTLSALKSLREFSIIEN